MVFVICILSGAVLQILNIWAIKESVVQNIVWISPSILLAQYLFMYSYATASNFTAIWFVTSAVNSLMTVLAGYYIWGDRLSSINFSGIFVILLGMAMLKI